MITALFAATALLVSNAPMEQFDLLCSELQDSSMRGRPKPKDDIRFRIDLKNARYCVGQCADQRTLTVLPQHLVFDQTDGMMGDTRLQTRQSVDRMTGRYTSVAVAGDRMMDDTSGQCSVQPYTGPVLGERLF